MKCLYWYYRKKLKGIQCWTSIWGIHFTGNLWYPFGWEPDYESCHVSMSCNSTRGYPFGWELIYNEVSHM